MSDYRAQRDSPEGSGIARQAWMAWSDAVNAAARPLIEPVTKQMSASAAADMFGFWLVWHLQGGFEGLLELGMNRATIYRKVKRFRDVMGVHPDDYEMPGVTIDLAVYRAAGLDQTT